MSLPLTVTAETSTTITLGWVPVPGAVGYTFWKDGRRVSNTQNGARSSVRFSKPYATLEVRTLLAGPAGSWPQPQTGVMPYPIGDKTDG